MATQTRDTSSQPPQVEKDPHGTPVSSYIGLAIIAAIALAMIVLQADGSPGF